MTRSSYACGQFNRRAARAHGGGERLRPPCDDGDAPCYSRAWRSRAARRLRSAERRADAAAAVPHPLERAAEKLRARPAARLLVFDPRPGALPRQRLLPARVDRRGVPADPDRAEDARGARHSRLAARARGETAWARPRDRPDRLG